VRAIIVVCGPGTKKKADMVERPKAFNHVGLRSDGPPGKTGLPFIQSSDSEPGHSLDPICFLFKLSWNR
jgi:hypothetical protein